MKLIKTITLLFALTLTSLFFTNCQNDVLRPEASNGKIKLTEKNFPEFIAKIQTNLRENSVIFDSFLEKEAKGTLTKQDFADIFEALQVPKNLDVSELEQANISSGVYDLMEYRKSQIEDKNMYGNCLFTHGEKNTDRSRGDMCERCCNKLVKIRNAMLDECDKQVLGLDETCSLSVTFAYWWKSRHC